MLASAATAGPVAQKASNPLAQNGHLLFTSTRDGGDQDVFIANADGSNQVNLTPGNATNEGKDKISGGAGKDKVKQ